MNIAYNIDCMEYLKTVPDKFYELAVCDPPYGIGIDGQRERYDFKNPKSSRKGHAFRGWDNQIPTEQYFRELERVSDNQIIWGGNYFVKHLKNGYKGWIIWDKGQHGLTMSDCEIAYSTFNTPTRVYEQNRVILLQEGTIHPTQKPVALYEWILKNYAKEGDKILDTHLGSGSSRIAAYNLGFDFVGCEIDEYYFRKQEERFARHTAQVNLFLEQE